jgi:hypothetical protein
VADMPDRLVGLMHAEMVKLELHCELVNFQTMKKQFESLVDVELLLVLIQKMN